MKYAKTLFLLLACLMLAGCEKNIPAETTVPTTQAHAEIIPEETIPTETAPDRDLLNAEFVAISNPLPKAIILEAEASGIAEERCADAIIDYSHAEDGYVMAQFLTETDTRLKVLIKGATTTYTYNLPQGQWTVFPLSDGNGSYQVCIYQNVYDNKYALVLSAIFDVALVDEFAPFLRPNQYVDYANANATVMQGLKIAAGRTDPLEKVAAVYDFVVTHLEYDYEKAATVKSGYLPVLDDVLAAKKGICFDYAALMTAMLRSQGIPSKLVVGYAGSTYHAWISVWTEENGWIDGAIFFDGQVWKRMDPTFASSQNRSDEIMDYIENGNYVAKYLY